MIKILLSLKNFNKNPNYYGFKNKINPDRINLNKRKNIDYLNENKKILDKLNKNCPIHVAFTNLFLCFPSLYMR